MLKLQSLALAMLLLLGAGTLAACNRADVGESRVEEQPYSEEGVFDPAVTNEDTLQGVDEDEGMLEGQPMEEGGGALE